MDIWSGIDHQKNWWTEQKLENSGEERDCMRARHPRDVGEVGHSLFFLLIPRYTSPHLSVDARLSQRPDVPYRYVLLIGNLLAHSIRPCSEWWWHNLILILTMNAKRWRQRRREPYGPCCSWHWWWLSLAPSSMPNQPLAILGYQQVGCHSLLCWIVICRLYIRLYRVGSI